MEVLTMHSSVRSQIRSTLKNLSILLTVAILFLCPAFSQDVLTYHNSNLRAGLNNKETTLTLANVNSASFGKLFVLPADGLVDAQPLYLSAITIAGVTHNLLIVATEHGTVYAYDADTGSPIWHVTTLKSGETTSDNRGCSQVTPEIGITSTPVIARRKTGNPVIYIVAMSKDGSGNYHQRLHALDATSGAELFKGPVDIQAKYPGTGGVQDGNGNVLAITVITASLSSIQASIKSALACCSTTTRYISPGLRTVTFAPTPDGSWVTTRTPWRRQQCSM
jgi:hypothetical protein